MTAAGKKGPRLAIAEAAEALAAVCRDPRRSPEDVADAERRLSDAFARYGRLMLARRARLRAA